MKRFRRFTGVALGVMAAEPVASTGRRAGGRQQRDGQLTQLVLGLLLVLGLIFFLAWLLRRVQQALAGQGAGH
jgi:flagellar protein FliO/FliZ